MGTQYTKRQQINTNNTYENLSVAWIYFIIHMLLEIVCFTILFRIYHGKVAWVSAMIYDFVAFVPQGLVGEYMNRHRRTDMATVGICFIALAIPIVTRRIYLIHIIGLVILCIGNACIHEAGAVATVTVSKGKLLHSAIFVGGGSFGVVIGQALGRFSFSLYWLYGILIVMELLSLLVRNKWVGDGISYPLFCVTGKRTGFYAILITAFLITAVRSYIGYVIPIDWKKEQWHSFVLFFAMGSAKAIGGYLADAFGVRRIGVLSTLFCIPFLIMGRENMLLSVVGVFLFSLTMSITFAMALSAIINNPGLAFGVTTVGLFTGVMIPYTFGRPNGTVGDILIVVFSLMSAAALYVTTTNENVI